MRFISAWLMWLLIVAALTAEELKLTGDVGSVEVERQVIVKEKLPLAKSLPFTLEAPAGGFGYQWDLPANVKANRKKNSLEITEAPRGILAVTATWTAVDFKAMTIEDKSATITLVVLSLKPPEPPDPLTAELKALYVADPSTDKPTNLAKLIAVFRAAENAALTNQDAKTAKQLADAVRTLARSYVAADALTAIRKRLGEIMAESMPSNPEELLTTETRQKAAAMYRRIANLLESIK